MRMFICAAVASGCVLGLQASALARDLAGDPPTVSPSYVRMQRIVPRHYVVPGYYDVYGPYQTQTGGVYDPYNDTYYPPNFRGPWH